MASEGGIVTRICDTSKASAERVPSDAHVLLHYLFLDMITEPLTARSRTASELRDSDWLMFLPPLRAFVYCAMCPFFCYPITILSLYGYARTLWTLQSPLKFKRPASDANVMYGVQKRVYDAQLRRIVERPVSKLAEMRHAIKVTAGVRGRFVDDAEQPNTAYYVVEQTVLQYNMFQPGNSWAWAVMSDFVRYCVPFTVACLFVRPCKRLAVDLRLWWQGRLRWTQLRHPVTNFFKSYQDYHRYLHRINVTVPAPKGSRPWSRDL